MSKGKKVGIGIVLILIVSLFVIPPARHWLGNLLVATPTATAPQKEFKSNILPPPKINIPPKPPADTASTCNCDTTKVREGWVKKSEPKKHYAYRPRKQSTPPPATQLQKVEINVKVTGSVEVKGEVKVKREEKQTPPPAMQATQVLKKGTNKTPCDTCSRPKKWKSNFWGKEFNEKNDRRKN